MTDISEKEVHALAEVLLGRVNAPEQEIYRASRDGLEAAARVRAEANAGEPVAWLDRLRTYGEPFHDGRNQGTVFKFKGGSRFFLADADAHPAPQPSGTVEVKPLADLIHDALTFAVWAAGEGLCPTNGPTAPEDFLYAYSAATGFENWDAIPHHVATILSALTAGKPEQAVPSGKHWFAVQSPTGVHIGLWDDGKIAYGVAAEYGSDYTIMELVELPVAPTAGGGDAE